MKPSVASVTVKKYAGKERHQAADLLAAEEPLEIRIGYGSDHDRKQKNVSVTMRTPGHDFELALGFLFTEGIIQDYSQVLSVKYCSDGGRTENYENIVRVELVPGCEPELLWMERNFYMTSSCGVCGKASIESVRAACPTVQTEKGQSSFRVSPDLLLRLPQLLREKQNIFEFTGGLHASALFDPSGNLIMLREDVGRHNALDKLIGAALAKGSLPLTRHLLILSGRASFELIQKAAMAGIEVVAAVGAPSSLAVQLAGEFDLTLVGFLRQDRFNVYSGDYRITDI